MATPLPSAMNMGRPPVTPPDIPSLTSIRADDGGTAQPGPGLAGALPKMFFELSQRIDTIAQLLPDQSQQLDSIKGQLQEVLALAVQNPGMQGRDQNQLLSGGGAQTLPYGG